MPRPFDTGEQRADWFERNCYRCGRWDLAAYDRDDWAHITDCEIDAGLQDAFHAGRDVSDDVARRMGWVDTDPPRYSWECPERLDRMAQVAVSSSLTTEVRRG